MDNSISVRKSVPWMQLAGVLALLASTVGGAAANMIPFHVPTRRELQRADQLVMSAAREARIATIVATGDGCRVHIAREHAQDLVFDGRSAAPYADDFAVRCFEDPIVRRWGNASLTLHLSASGR